MFCCFPGSLPTCTLCICRATGQRRLLGLGENRRESVVLKCSKERTNLLSEKKSFFKLHKNYGLVKCSYGKSLLQEFQLKHKTMERTRHPIDNVCKLALAPARRHQPRMEEPPVMDLHLAVRKMDNKQYLLLSKYNLQQ